MQVVDATTLQLVGYVSDISLTGIKIDSGKLLPVNQTLKLRVDLTPDVANKSYLTFNGRIKWCEMDKFEPNSYNVGIEVENLSREDYAIFMRMYNQYGMDAKQ
ncbi:MAG: PilZ domain-containing protein [Anaerolineales bacterium]|nr:PilZ domain-containing protein [Anaerolineales bacterium]